MSIFVNASRSGLRRQVDYLRKSRPPDEDARIKAKKIITQRCKREGKRWGLRKMSRRVIYCCIRSDTRQVIQQAIAAGIKNVWMQPGAEDDQASQAAREAGLNVIDDGSCVLVLLAIEARKPRD
jgi:hypothetical protein